MILVSTISQQKSHAPICINLQRWNKVSQRQKRQRNRQLLPAYYSFHQARNNLWPCLGSSMRQNQNLNLTYQVGQGFSRALTPPISFLLHLQEYIPTTYNPSCNSSILTQV